MSKDSDSPFDPNCFTGHDTARLDRMERTLNEVKSALVGNPSIGHRGIVPRLDIVESSLAQIAAERASERSKRAGAIATVSTLSAIAGAIGGFALWLVQQLTHRT